MDSAPATAFTASVPEIVQSILHQPDQLQHVIPFFFKTREYRKLHEIVKAVIKTGHVLDDTCLRLYGCGVTDLTIASVCQIWAWYFSFKLSPPLLHLFGVFVKHICISDDTLVAAVGADFAANVRKTEDLIDSHLQTEDHVEWLQFCLIFGHMKLLYMFHGPETMRQLEKKVKWHDMSFIFTLTFDWKSFFRESLSSDDLKKEIAIQLLVLKFRFCDAMYASTGCEQVLYSRQQVVHHLLKQPDIGRYLLTCSMVDMMLQSTKQQQDVQMLAHVIVKQFSQKENSHVKANETALNSPAFQTAVVGSTIAELLQVASQGSDLHPILHMLSDTNTGWIEFQYSFPKEENKCWHAIRKASQMMMQSKQSAENLFSISSSSIGLILNGLRNFVFLQSLLPLNQSRCMIVYSMLLLRWNSKDQMSEPLIDALISMLTGLRSIWLFDFVPPSFLLLHLPNDSPQVDTLIKVITSRILKQERLLQDYNDNILKQKGLGNKNRLHAVLVQAFVEAKASGHVFRGQVVNEVVDGAISKVLKGLQKAVDEDSERFVRSAKHLHRLSLLLKLGPAENSSSSRKIAALVKKVLRNIFSNDEILNNDEAKFLEAVCERRQKLDAILSEEFISELCNKVFGPRSDAMHEASSSTGVREIIFRVAKRFKSDKAVKSVFHANLIRYMLESCNETECTSLCEELRSRFVETNDPDNSLVLIKSLEVWATHRKASSEAEHRDAAAALIMDLTNRLRNGVGEEVNVELIVSTLNLTQALIRNHSGKGLPVNAALNVTAFAVHEIRRMGLAAGCVTEFARILLAVQAVLFQAIVCQKIVVITVMPYFNILTSRLFRMCLSLCDEQLLNTCCSVEAKSAAERCAQSVSTLLTSLCNLCDFHPFAASLVAVYVDYAHSHVLHPDIKPILLSAVYRLLRVIGKKHSQTLERQHVRLKQAAKDLLKQLMDNYEQLYRYKGLV